MPVEQMLQEYDRLFRVGIGIGIGGDLTLWYDRSAKKKE